jgi:SAM-dependent methyltransferase
LRHECKNYTFSQFDPSIPRGSIHPEQKHRSEDLEDLTFEDSSFDVVITQDVFEHIFRPDLAAKEISRTLKLGGAHILTTPLTQQNRPSRRRCRLEGEDVVELMPPIFHGNPMSASGSIVTVDWGYDILAYLAHYGQTSSSMYIYDDVERGLRAPLIEVIVCSKSVVPEI